MDPNDQPLEEPRHSQNIYISHDNPPNRRIIDYQNEEERKSQIVSQINERSESSFRQQSLPQIPSNFYEDIDNQCDIDEADCDENENQILSNSQLIVQKLRTFQANDNEIKKKDVREVQGKFDQLQLVIYHQFQELKLKNEQNDEVQGKCDLMIELLSQCK